MYKKLFVLLLFLSLSVTVFAGERPLYPKPINDGSGFIFMLLTSAKDSDDVLNEFDSRLNVELPDIDFFFGIRDNYHHLTISYILNDTETLNRDTVLEYGKKYKLDISIHFSNFYYGSREYTIEKLPHAYMLKEEHLSYVTISAVGDCTLGYDEAYGYTNSFMDEFYKQNMDYSYFFGGVSHIFKDDDLTIANLETTLTDSTIKADKEFRFRGLPEFTNILKAGYVEAVNISNNHTYDYFQVGYDDTIRHLAEAGITYFGDAKTAVMEINGIRIGLMGNKTWSDNAAIRDKIKSDIQKLREADAHVIIASFHWGIERDNYPTQYQKVLGRYAIDNGADLVIGHHPHVLQGIEEYNGKFIVYSLGNFCFGGNRNPSDKDTMIFQQTFTFANDVLHDHMDIKIIPCSISSVKNRNDFRPTILEGQDRERVVSRLIEYSDGMIDLDLLNSAFE